MFVLLKNVFSTATSLNLLFETDRSFVSLPVYEQPRPGQTVSDMLSISQKGLFSGTFKLVHQFWSGCGSSRPFSSCQIRAARRVPTEEELSTMSPKSRQYYKQMEDPLFRRQRSDKRMSRSLEYFDNLRQKGEYASYLEKRNASLKARYHNQPGFKFSNCMLKWLLRLTGNPREAFEWKTHLPMIYQERVRKTCSTCLSH
jgi:hypothetical protein